MDIDADYGDFGIENEIKTIVEKCLEKDQTLIHFMWAGDTTHGVICDDLHVTNFFDLTRKVLLYHFDMLPTPEDFRLLLSAKSNIKVVVEPLINFIRSELEIPACADCTATVKKTFTEDWTMGTADYNQYVDTCCLFQTLSADKCYHMGYSIHTKPRYSDDRYYERIEEIQECLAAIKNDSEDLMFFMIEYWDQEDGMVCDWWVNNDQIGKTQKSKLALLGLLLAEINLKDTVQYRPNDTRLQTFISENGF